MGKISYTEEYKYLGVKITASGKPVSYTHLDVYKRQGYRQDTYNVDTI